MTKTPLVTTDTNLLLHPTPRRYLTALEELRARKVLILPTTDREVRYLIQKQAADHYRKNAKRDRKTNEHQIGESEDKAIRNAAWWWANERTCTQSAYIFARSLGEPLYEHMKARTPAHAFKNENDRRIYAEAMAHKVNVLTSTNRKSVKVKEIEKHFRTQGIATPPVAVHSLWEHTLDIAQREGREAREVALEAVLGAAIEEGWKPTPAHVAQTIKSAHRFKSNLSWEGSRSKKEGEHEQEPDPKDVFASELHKAIETLNALDRVSQLHRLKIAYETRPRIARQTEGRYHQAAKEKRKGRGIGE